MDKDTLRIKQILNDFEFQKNEIRSKRNSTILPQIELLILLSKKIIELENKIKPMKNKLLTPEENPQGLHNRYVISKTSGEPVDDDAEYFCLRLDGGGDDPIHIAACRKAVLTYAEEIKNHLPVLSSDIIERYGEKIN